MATKKKQRYTPSQQQKRLLVAKKQSEARDVRSQTKADEFWTFPLVLGDELHTFADRQTFQTFRDRAKHESLTDVQEAARENTQAALMSFQPFFSIFRNAQQILFRDLAKAYKEIQCLRELTTGEHQLITQLVQQAYETSQCLDAETVTFADLTALSVSLQENQLMLCVDIMEISEAAATQSLATELSQAGILPLKAFRKRAAELKLPRKEFQVCFKLPFAAATFEVACETAADSVTMKSLQTDATATTLSAASSTRLSSIFLIRAIELIFKKVRWLTENAVDDKFLRVYLLISEAGHEFFKQHLGMPPAATGHTTARYQACCQQLQLAAQNRQFTHLENQYHSTISDTVWLQRSSAFLLEELQEVRNAPHYVYDTTISPYVFRMSNSEVYQELQEFLQKTSEPKKIQAYLASHAKRFCTAALFDLLREVNPSRMKWYIDTGFQYFFHEQISPDDAVALYLPIFPEPTPDMLCIDMSIRLDGASVQLRDRSIVLVYTFFFQHLFAEDAVTEHYLQISSDEFAEARAILLQQLPSLPPRNAAGVARMQQATTAVVIDGAYASLEEALLESCRTVIFPMLPEQMKIRVSAEQFAKTASQSPALARMFQRLRELDAVDDFLLKKLLMDTSSYSALCPDTDFQQLTIGSEVYEKTLSSLKEAFGDTTKALDFGEILHVEVQPT